MLSLALCLGVVGARPVVGDGAFVAAGVRAGVVAGTYHATAERETVADGFVGPGLVVDVALGHALVPGTALALALSGGLALFVDGVDGRVSSMFMFASTSAALRLHQDFDAFHVMVGGGAELGALQGGHADVPGQAVRQSSLIGPMGTAGLGWRSEKTGLDVGIQVDVAYLRAQQTTMIPVMVMAHARWLSF
jgi:hypothetical protein